MFRVFLVLLCVPLLMGSHHSSYQPWHHIEFVSGPPHGDMSAIITVIQGDRRAKVYVSGGGNAPMCAMVLKRMFDHLGVDTRYRQFSTHIRYRGLVRIQTRNGCRITRHRNNGL